MDWAEEKYDVSTCGGTGCPNGTVRRQNLNPLLCLAAETSDRTGQDGSEGVVPLHPSAHVLGSL